MTSCLIDVLNDTVRGDTDAPAAPLTVTVGDRHELLEALAAVPDPRRGQGRRYPLTAVLAVAVCAVICGAVTFTGIADWLTDVPDADLPALGLHTTRPAGTTVWRILVWVDARAVHQALAGWLHHRAPPETAATGQVTAVIAVDGKAERGSRTATAAAVMVLSAYDTTTGITLAQRAVADKGGEIAQFTPLIDDTAATTGSVHHALFLADALHAQRTHADDLHERGAYLMVRVKANQPGLHRQLAALPWARIPVGHRERDHGHGRHETRTLKTAEVHLPGGLKFPHATRTIRITRTRTINHTTTRETAYLITTLPAEFADPAQLAAWARAEWHIENRLHYPKDVTLREDAHLAHTGAGPTVFSTLRATAIGYHRTQGATNIAAATRHASHRATEMIHKVTATPPRTQ